MQRTEAKAECCAPPLTIMSWLYHSRAQSLRDHRILRFKQVLLERRGNERAVGRLGCARTLLCLCHLPL